MSDLDPGMAGQPDLELSVAAVLANNQDVKMLLRVLGKSLQDSLGDRVEIRRAGGGGLLHKKPDELQAVVVRLDPDEYEARLDGHAVRCSVGRSSGGIRIRSEQLPIEQWLHRLLSALQQEAVGNQAARQALQDLVVGQ